MPKKNTLENILENTLENILENTLENNLANIQDSAQHGKLSYHRVHSNEQEQIPMIPATEALERLIAGNKRFVSNTSEIGHLRPSEYASEQKPFAIVLGCSDSRVPAEIVFDQGLGDLFVIRVAGNIVAPSQVGSVEFAAERFGTRLVVVLGHSQCGAILATIEQLGQPSEGQSPNLRSIVNRIRPSVAPLLHGSKQLNDDLLVHQAVRANICVSVDHLRHGSALLEQLVQQDGLVIVGAEYSLNSGLVDFFGD